MASGDYPERSAIDPKVEAEWRTTLTQGHPTLRVLSRLVRMIPADPRCKICHNPFAGIGGAILKPLGFRPSRKNPNMCQLCCEKMPPGGAEVEIAVLFADVRGSTQLGGAMTSSDYAALLNRFYATASRALIRHDAVIDKLIGDEVMALFVPGFAGAGYRRNALAAALDLREELGWTPGGTPWLDVGIAVHAGAAYVGNVGSEDIVDFTALGDTINVAARLQSAAAPGEIVLTDEIHAAARDLLPEPPAERVIELRGKEEKLRIRSLPSQLTRESRTLTP